MNQAILSARRLLQSLTLVGLLIAVPAHAQLTPAEERLKILTDPESVKAKVDKDKSRPPRELLRSQIAPFDVLPYVKANHWSTLSLELQSNYDDYLGELQTAPVRLLGMSQLGGLVLDSPQEVSFRREARLLKGQRARLGMQILMPRISKELGLELTRLDAIRADELWQASLKVLEPYQMLILVLSKGSSDFYGRWNQYQSLAPLAADRGDVQAYDRQRYYRLVLPQEPGRPLPLSPHPLTWTTLSHVVWDGAPAESLTPAQQQAMLDWLHWGGQLILFGGAQPSFAALSDSFLGPYLPASLSGENHLLHEADLKPLADAYRPVVPFADREAPMPVPLDDSFAVEPGSTYLPAAPIHPASNRPVYLAGLRPQPGATPLFLGGSSTRILGVEQRVGRGRVLMLGLTPTDPALAAWPGLDTFLRRVVLRRPEDPPINRGGWRGRSYEAAKFGSLAATDLSWFRILSRDLGAVHPSAPAPTAATARGRNGGLVVDSTVEAGGELLNTSIGAGSAVAEWVDSSALPRLSRDSLEEASGISIPSSRFVLQVILAYVIALVPLNWLLCRYVLGRREWAWVVVPLLSLAFAVGVERVSAYDMGYDTACDEISVLETYGEYPRAHLSRFASLYTTGRNRFSISFPDDPTALALPLDNGRSLRGEDVSTTTWQSQPFPALEGFLVQPRSLSMFRTEQMVDLAGSIALTTDETGERIVNSGDLDLQDAVVVRPNPTGPPTTTYLGSIKSGTTVPVKAIPAPRAAAIGKGELNPFPILEALQSHAEATPETQGEVRLVAWVPKVIPGVKLEPAVDRRRGFTAVVVHLRVGPPPDPSTSRFDYLAPRKRNVETTDDGQRAAGGSRVAPAVSPGALDEASGDGSSNSSESPSR